MKSLVIFAALFSSTSAFASEAVICAGTLNSGTYVEFEMPVTGPATLAFDSREFVIDMDCMTYAADIPVTECLERIPGDSKYIVTLAMGKAHVSQTVGAAKPEIYKGAIDCK
ncbi:hypothetical protein AZI85_04940 [Bdellovibrio bacteriovorus]|uniref:Uncharacterized protein n=1 Tax=Bdellovibrio bacteriovorus TaxID=959 RepID=A0A150WI66_BDEBC|nr:hypothetical protein [Bdellovibrio bacteriovorus]KYG63382.1 hypothetical protein AZI85_04940 [Bdellovibrio bacteriovorus]